MIERRTFIASASGLLLSTVGAPRRANAAAAAAATTPQVNRPESELFEHVVARIECPLPSGGSESGTGFFYSFFDKDMRGAVALITNKHVALGHDTCRITFTGKNKDGGPDLEKLLPVEITEFQKSVIPHPDPSVDLALINLTGVLNQLAANGTPAYFINVTDSAIPTSAARNELTPLEDILTVGFPGSVWDYQHNLPIFHRGITATPPNVDFQGRKEFLIDSAVWPGASGSPVFLYEQGALIDWKTNGTSFGWRVMLLGIVYATVQQSVSGGIFVQQVPTQPHVESGVPSNLGLCISSSRIFDFQPLLLKQGVKIPSDFKMRTSSD